MTATTETAVDPVERDNAARLKRLAEMKANPDDHRHGTMTGVVTGCDCDRCKARNRNKAKERYDAVNRKITGEEGIASTPWSDEDIAFLKESMDAPAQEVAEKLGRSLNSILQKRQHVKNNPVIEGSKRKPWTDDELKFVADNPEMKAAEIAHKLGRTIGAIRLARNKIKKSAA